MVPFSVMVVCGMMHDHGDGVGENGDVDVTAVLGNELFCIIAERF
jgi:hypothetical protein